MQRERWRSGASLIRDRREPQASRVCGASLRFARAALRPGYTPGPTGRSAAHSPNEATAHAARFSSELDARDVRDPCYISAVTMNYVASIFRLALDSTHVGLPCILHLHSESLITRGRNKMIIKFLSEDFTHLFWIDSDIAFSSQAVFRLLLADRDVAAGV
jgi:hypothetical protein